MRLETEGADLFEGTPATRYSLTGDDIDITLWYRAADARWIGLEVQRDSGVLRYTDTDGAHTR